MHHYKYSHLNYIVISSGQKSFTPLLKFMNKNVAMLLARVKNTR